MPRHDALLRRTELLVIGIKVSKVEPSPSRVRLDQMSNHSRFCAFFVLPLLLGLFWQSGGCHDRSGSMNTKQDEKNRNIQTGNWGGSQIAMEVTAEGAQINYPCAHGSIKGPLKLDRGGKFDLSGTHVSEHPGPIRVGEDNAGRPARYTGSVDGQTMTVTVTLTDKKETVGTFSLTYGRRSRVPKCL